MQIPSGESRPTCSSKSDVSCSISHTRKHQVSNRRTYKSKPCTQVRKADSSLEFAVSGQGELFLAHVESLCSCWGEVEGGGSCLLTSSCSTRWWLDLNFPQSALDGDCLGKKCNVSELRGVSEKVCSLLQYLIWVPESFFKPNH